MTRHLSGTRRRRRLLLSALTAALLAGAAGSSPATAGEEPLRVAIEGEYPPFSATGKDGKLTGFDVDIAKALCRAIEASCKLVKQQWDRMIPDLVAGRYEMIVSSMSISQSRRRQIDFTDPYYQTPAKFVGRNAKDLPTSLADLKGKRVGVQKATNHDSFLTRNHAGDIVLVRYDTLGKAAADLGAGKIDYLFGDALALTHGLLKTKKGQDYVFVGPDMRDPRYFGQGVAIAVQKGNDPLRERLNRALAALHADGTYDAIERKYFDFDLETLNVAPRNLARAQ